MTAPRADRRGFAPSINRRAAPMPHPLRDSRPRRLHRKRGRSAVTPPGALYVGRPTIWSNPFAGRKGIGHARSVILYRAWVEGHLTRYVLERAGFSAAEIDALARWRRRLIERLPELRGHDLQCWCPLTSAWCHADVQIDFANFRDLGTLAA